MFIEWIVKYYIIYWFISGKFVGVIYFDFFRGFRLVIWLDEMFKVWNKIKMDW